MAKEDIRNKMSQQEEGGGGQELDAPPQPSNPIHGDILESIFSHVPLLHLVPASHVSKSWKRSVSTSLHYINPPKPWLLIHKQSTRPPYTVSSHAYDPRSRGWIDISSESPSINSNLSVIGTLRSSHSSLLYVLTPSSFSFSSDTLHMTWHHVDPPMMWRRDPIVAVVGGRHVVVAGGVCDFEDDPLGVEVYDTEANIWDTCPSMPAELKDSSASTWLSTATSVERMFVAEKSSGVAYSFDPRTKVWFGPYDLRPDGNDLCCCHIIICNGSRLILVGLIGSEDEESVTGVKLWELDDMSLAVRREMGEMPKPLVEKLRGEVLGVNSSVSVCFMGDLVYIINGLAPEEVFFCEIWPGSVCKWGSVQNAVVNGDDSRLKDRLVFTGANVGLPDLQRAMVSAKKKFTVK